MAQKEGKKKEKNVRYFDYSLLFIVIFLLGFGLVMLYSTSSYSGATKYNDAAHYLKRQMASTALGLVVMAFLSKVDYHFWRKLGGLAYIGALGLCTAVIFVGHESKGQARWLYIAGVSFQPSELAKLAVILFLAMIIYKIPKPCHCDGTYHPDCRSGCVQQLKYSYHYYGNCSLYAVCGESEVFALRLDGTCSRRGRCCIYPAGVLPCGANSDLAGPDLIG